MKNHSDEHAENNAHATPGTEAAPMPPTNSKTPAAPTPEKCEEAVASTEFSHPADVAEHLENLSLTKQVCYLSALPIEDAADALAEGVVLVQRHE